MFKTRFTLSILPLALRDRMSHDSTPMCHIRHGESSERVRRGDFAARLLNLSQFLFDFLFLASVQQAKKREQRGK